MRIDWTNIWFYFFWAMFVIWCVSAFANHQALSTVKLLKEINKRREEQFIYMLVWIDSLLIPKKASPDEPTGEIPVPPPQFQHLRHYYPSYDEWQDR